MTINRSVYFSILALFVLAVTLMLYVMTSPLMAASSEVPVGNLDGTSQNGNNTNAVIYSQDEHWVVYANKNPLGCTAITSYENQDVIALTIMEDKVLFTVVSDKVRYDHPYVVNVNSSSGLSSFEYRAQEKNMVIFPNIDARFFAAFATQPSVTVEGLGKYNLVGSFKATGQLIKCYEELINF